MRVHDKVIHFKNAVFNFLGELSL